MVLRDFVRARMRYDRRVTDLARRALAVNQAFLALGNERFQAEGAVFVRNRALPEVRNCNHVAHVTASTPEGIDRLLARVECEFAGLPYRCFDLDFTALPELEARLAHEGYRRDDVLIMVLEGEPAGEPRPHDMREVEDEAGWTAYGALNELDWAEDNPGEDEDPNVDWTAETMLRARRIKSPPMRYWLAYLDGEPRSHTSSWVSEDGMGQVEDLFTHPDFRHRGLATALIDRGVADCRERGAGPVVIACDPDDTPKDMYAALGFRPVAIKRSWWKAASPPPAP